MSSTQRTEGRDKKWRKIQGGQREGQDGMGSGKATDFVPSHKEVQSPAL